ncbi:MAG: phenylpyruvate tautomerase MIF-related protein [Alphaproteobacteria bacterium]|nr:phenylpyruvate tautomerase MIF-related protein [Alphaproteobacteria bacterium]
MPFLTIYTNSKIEGKEKADFLYDAVEFIASELQKPIERIILNLIKNSEMLFGTDKTSKGALVELKAIGFPQNKAEIALKLTKFLADRLEVEFEHVEIEFIDMPPSTLAIAGKLRG